MTKQTMTAGKTAMSVREVLRRDLNESFRCLSHCMTFEQRVVVEHKIDELNDELLKLEEA